MTPTDVVHKLVKSLSQEREEKMRLLEQNEILLKRVDCITQLLNDAMKQHKTSEESLEGVIIDLRRQNEKLLRQTEELTRILDEAAANRSVTEETLRKTVADLIKELDALKSELAAKDARVYFLEKQVQAQRSKRFSKSTEQAKLLNNRLATPDRSEDKENFDGKSVTPSSTAESGSTSADRSEKAKSGMPGHSARQKLYGPEPDGNARVDNVIYHKLGDYYTLPPGARFMTRNGNIGISYYTVDTRIPERIVREVYEVATVVLPGGELVRTMETPHVAKKCPLDASMMGYAVAEKYVFHMPVETIKKKLRYAGAIYPSSTLNRYIQLGMEVLMNLLQEPMRDLIRQSKYLMMDETVELVGVTEEESKKRHYRKRYLWAFYDKVRNMVYYVYENGSRARKVVTDFLQGFSGHISTDGYVAYSIFDDAEKYPDITHVGCWTHARRLFVEALESMRNECTAVINMIGELFAVEIKAKLCKMNEEERKVLRKAESVPILKRLKVMLEDMKADRHIMENPLMKKAVGYTLNQWQSLENYITSGLVEISNNLCEQRMKPIKLTLKNCQNIGSEEAAERAAFTQSLTESCRLNKIDPQKYLTDIFQRISSGEHIFDIKQLLPCFCRNNC